MARLIILLGPISSALGGMALGFAMDQLILYAIGSMMLPALGVNETAIEKKELEEIAATTEEAEGTVGDGSWADKSTDVLRRFAVVQQIGVFYRNPIACMLRFALGLYAVTALYPKGTLYLFSIHYC